MENEASAFFQKNLQPTIALLQQLTNYGSNLMPRAWLSIQRQNTDSVFIASLLKHSLAMMDSITILLGSGCVVPAFIPLRSLYEGHAYMRWILAVRIFRMILERYRPGELEAFQRRFREEWREPFRSVPQVHTDTGGFRTF